MYQEIQDIFLGLLPSIWSKEELQEIWNLIYNKDYTKKLNKRHVKEICGYIKTNPLGLNAKTIRHPDPSDTNRTCNAMWIPVLLFIPFQKIPLYINHKDQDVKKVVEFRLRKGR